MNIELKNIKIHQDMSDETNCFSATIYVDGKKAGTVRNDGRGGCHLYYWDDHVVGQRLFDWAKTQVDSQFEQLDRIIDKMLDEQEVIRWLKRNTRNKTLFMLNGDKKGEWRTVKAPYQPAVKNFLIKKYGTNLQCIANESLEGAVAYC